MNMLLQVDETGKILNIKSGSHVSLEEGYHFVIYNVTYDYFVASLGGTVVIENFVPKIIPKDGTTLPPIVDPEPELTLEQKVELLEKALQEQRQEAADFKETTNYTMDFLSEELFKTNMMKEGM